LKEFGRVAGRMYQKSNNEAHSSFYFPCILLPVAEANLLSTSRGSQIQKFVK